MDNIRRFKADLRAQCKKHNIKLKLIHAPTINYVGNAKIQVSGYFDSDAMELAVATDKAPNEWLEILIHESCHLDQYLDDNDFWNDSFIDDVDSSAILDLWLNKRIELNPKQIKDVVKKIIDLERDCDLRAIEKIKKYNLDSIIDLRQYTRKSNAYHLSYDAVAQLRKWNKPLKSPYQVKRIADLFSTTMSKGYKLTKSQFKEVAKECY